MRLIDADALNIRDVSTDYNSKVMGVTESDIDDTLTINAIPIPEDATNGDVIKAMFHYGSYGTNGNEVHVFGVGGNGVLVFTKDWWNTKYKAESEDKE